MFCKKCGGKSRENAKFCDNCGAELEPTDSSADITGSANGVVVDKIECRSCGTSNPGLGKVCSKCKQPIVISCPDCGSETPIDRNQCLGCNSDIDEFNKINELFQQLTALQDQKKWTLIKNLQESQPKVLPLTGPTGTKLQSDVNEIYAKAEEMVYAINELRLEINQLVENKQFKTAITAITRYRDINPDDREMETTEQEIGLKILADKFDRDFAKLRFLQAENKWGLLRDIVDQLTLAKNNLKLPEKYVWSEEWIKRFKQLESFGQESNVSASNIKELELEAQRLFDNKEFERCTEVCKKGLSLDSSNRLLKGLKHQASLLKIEDQYHHPEIVIKEKKDTKIQILKQLEDDALEAYKKQAYEACITICNNADELSMSSKKCDALRQKSIQKLKAIQQHLDRIEYFYAREDWPEVNHHCDELLKLKTQFSKALEIKERVQTEIANKRKSQIRFLKKISAGVVAISLCLVTAFLILRSRKKDDLRSTFSHHHQQAEILLSNAKANVSDDRETALQQLKEAREHLELASRNDLSEILTKSQKQAIEALANEILDYKTSIDNARILYHQNIKQAKSALKSAEIDIDNNPDNGYSLFLQAQDYLAGLESESISVYLDETKRQTIIELKNEIQDSLRRNIFNKALSEKARADELKAFEADEYQIGKTKLSDAYLAFEDGFYLKASSLADEARVAFGKAAGFGISKKNLFEIRGKFIEKLNRVNLSAIKKFVPDKYTQITETRDLANRSLNNDDYQMAIVHYKTAMALLELAEENAKALEQENRLPAPR